MKTFLKINYEQSHSGQYLNVKRVRCVCLTTLTIKREIYSQKSINYSANLTWMTRKKNVTRQEMEVLIEEISNNLCVMRIYSATVDGNFMKFFTILLRALDTLKTIRLMLDWLIPTVLRKTAWNDPEAKKRRPTIICSITGRGENLFCFWLQIISQNMCKIHYWVYIL